MKPILIFLSRVATRNVGMVEAAILVATASGATNVDLENLTGLPKASIWSGTNALRKKGLITTKCQVTGRKIHTLTSSGRKLLDWALGNDE